MKFTVFLSGLLLLFLLPDWTESVEDTVDINNIEDTEDNDSVDINTLARIIDFFEQNYKRGTDEVPRQYTTAINVPKDQCQQNFNLNTFLTEENAEEAPVVPLRGLGLLHLCVQGIQGDMNTAVLAKMTRYFYDNVQPKTQKETDAQYAIAISVSKDQCTDEQFDIQTVFSEQDAKHVKDKLNNGEKCLQLTEDEKCTSLGNVIATRPDINIKPVEHAEHILLYPLGNSPMDSLLVKAGQNPCVVFYSYNSPCVNTCIQSKDNILEGLSNWINKNKDGNNAFVFQEIWQKDSTKKLQEEFLKINERAPLYRCKKTNNVMECQKCVENNIMKAFCLPEKK